jgi:hypothetical protein
MFFIYGRPFRLFILMMLVAAETIKRRITGRLMVVALERMYVEGSGRGLV